ncbi:MAG TPA: dihydrofolate reductase family protein [Candidatus Saccharimonadales bacterium]|nr:dihydrofolate reductase family protein [Candidatus Saccharimonadales bacterium]
MSKVKSHMSMSIDGFVSGPNPSQSNPLGTNGEKLHDWIFNNPAEAGDAHPETLKKHTGAAIIGYNMYHEAIPHWDGTGPLGDDIPCFVLTEEGKVPENAPAAFTFVTDGIESALEKAKAAAGNKNVWIGGGANTIQQYIKAGLLDELQLHIVPLLLGGGTSMFGELGEFIELDKVEVKDAPDVTHFTYHFKKG